VAVEHDLGVTPDDAVVSAEAAAIVKGLAQPVHELDGLAEDLPARSGVCAWWARPKALPALRGPVHTGDLDVRLLYVWIASNLRRRIVRDHLRRSGSSTLRRTLSGLLVGAEGYRT
jgi:hypothetical protein